VLIPNYSVLLLILKGGVPSSYEDVSESWVFANNETGYVNGDLFYQWFTRIFVPHCGQRRPVLLVMDNHESHVTIKTVEEARWNQIILLGFQETQHISCSHWM